MNGETAELYGSMPCIIEDLGRTDQISHKIAGMIAKNPGYVNVAWPDAVNELRRLGIIIGDKMTQDAQTTLTGPTRREIQAMAPKDQIKHHLHANKSAIAAAMPKHLTADRLLRVFQTAVTTTPGLLECRVASLLGAVMRCAEMGLEPNTILGHAYLVPFNRNVAKRGAPKQWVKDIQVIPGYKGLVTLAHRSGHVTDITANLVYKNDKFDFEFGSNERLSHRRTFGKRGAMLCVYAHAKMKNGGDHFEIMSIDEVKEIMTATQSAGAYGPWKDHFEQMARKTVIRRLANQLPLSVEFATAAAADAVTIELDDDGYNVVETDDYGPLGEGPKLPIDNADHRPKAPSHPPEPPPAPAPAPKRARKKTADPEPKPVPAGGNFSIAEIGNFVRMNINDRESAKEVADLISGVRGQEGHDALVEEFDALVEEFDAKATAFGVTYEEGGK